MSQKSDEKQSTREPYRKATLNASFTVEKEDGTQDQLIDVVLDHLNDLRKLYKNKGFTISSGRQDFHYTYFPSQAEWERSQVKNDPLGKKD